MGPIDVYLIRYITLAIIYLFIYLFMGIANVFPLKVKSALAI